MYKLGLFLSILILFIVLVGPVKASQLYEVDVSVDVVDKDASLAREKAMVAANRQGLINLLKKITTEEGVQQVAELNDNQILNFVKEVLVVSEKVSAVRYMAELKVRFNASVLRKYLREKNIPFTENGGLRVLVLPLWQNAAALNETEIATLWSSTWQNSDASGGMLEFVVADVNALNIDTSAVLEFDAVTLEKLSRYYSADELYILYASQSGNMLQVKIFAPSGKGGIEQTIEFDNNSNDMNTIVEKTKAVISERIKKYNLEEDNKTYEMLILYQYDNLRDWLLLQKDIQSAPYVKSVKEDAIGTGRVQFRIKYAGSFNRLEQVLNSRNMQLVPYDGFYVISKGI